MKVQSVMTQGVYTCRPDSDLASVAKKMFDGDCGLLPVLENGRLCGVITDRDICMAVMVRGERPSDIRVDQVMSGEHYTCRADEDVKSALQTMAEHQVRRLPVVGRDGELDGVLALNDLILEARASEDEEETPTCEDIVAVLQAVGRHRDLPVAG